MAIELVHSSFPKIVDVAVLDCVVEADVVALDVTDDVAEEVTDVVNVDVKDVVTEDDAVLVAVVEGEVLSQLRKTASKCIFNAEFKEDAIKSHLYSPFEHTIVPSARHSRPYASVGDAPRPRKVNS